MGLRYTKLPIVEAHQEAPSLDEYLTLYDTIARNIARQKRIRLRRTHVNTIAIIEERVEIKLALLEWKVGSSIPLIPYRARYRAIQAQCLGTLQLSYKLGHLRIPRDLRGHPIVQTITGVGQQPKASTANSL